jgi:hypothetical protein
LQAAIKKKFGLTAEIKEGYNGIFDVSIDGERVYSKDTTFRFPTDKEIFGEIRTRLKRS